MPQYLYHFEPSDIYDALASVKYLTLTKLQKNEVTSVQSFLSRNVFYTQSQVKILCQLPIFSVLQDNQCNHTIQSLKGTNNFAIAEGSGYIFKKEFLPPSCLVISQDGNEQNLIKVLKSAGHVKVMDGVTLLTEVVFPLVMKGQYYSWNNFQEFMLSVLDSYQYFSLFYDTLFVENLKRLPFIQTSLNRYKYVPPSQLYDPDIKELKAIFSDDLFPGPTYYQYLPTLRKCGLKSSADVTSQDLFAILKNITVPALPHPVQCDAKIYNKMVNIFQLLYQYSHLLTGILDNGQILANEILNKSKKCSIFPVTSEKPSDYPECIPWKGQKLTLASSLCEQLSSIDKATIAGSQLYFITHNPPQCHRILCHTQTEAECVIEHFKLIIENQSTISASQLNDLVVYTYKYLSQVYTKINVKMQPEKWVWIENLSTFVAPSVVALSKNDTFKQDLEPYLYILSPMMKKFSKLLMHYGVSEVVTGQQILNVLQAIRDDPKINGPNAWIMVRAILQWMAENDIQYDGDILVPVISNLNYPQLKPSQEVTYTDNNMFLKFIQSSDEDHCFELVHPFVTQWAPRLGLKPLSDHLNITKDIFDDAGQHEPLITRLGNILKEYKDGLTIIKELIQNADDAGATEVNILFDNRQHKTSKLLFEGMADAHGPALVVHNNRTFSDSDFENIIKLAGATKLNEPLKIGKFGVGFCSVYHITDIPSFVSRDCMLYIFDPTLNHLKDVVQNEGRPGKKVKYLSKIVSRSNQLAPYLDLFGFDRTSSFHGTMFRLPFRQHASQISSTIYDVKMIDELRNSLVSEGSSLLLFLSNVKKITFSSITKDLQQHSDEVVIEKQIKQNIITLSTSNMLQGNIKKEAWLVSSCHETTLMRTASVACQLELVSSGYEVRLIEGSLFCFLPLNAPSTGLPVHVSANFAVMTNRSGIWTTDSTDGQWNHQLMKTTVSKAYLCLLEKLQNMSQNKDLHNYTFYSLWPLESRIVKSYWGAMVCQLYKELCARNLCYSTSVKGWQTLQGSVFLSPKIFSHTAPATGNVKMKRVCFRTKRVCFSSANVGVVFSLSLETRRKSPTVTLVSALFRQLEVFCILLKAFPFVIFRTLCLRRDISQYMSKKTWYRLLRKYCTT